MEDSPMKASMSRRLVGYFVLVLATFILFMTSSFTIINQRTVLQSYESNMVSQVQAMADTLAALESQPYTDGQTGAEGPGKGRGIAGGRNYQNLLRHLDDLSPYDVWVVDPDANQVVTGQGGREITYDTLPDDGALILADVLAGEVVQNRSLSMPLGHGTITAGAPVFNQEGEVLYAVLMHGQVSTPQETSHQMVRLLFVSSLFAVVVALLLALWLSRRFVAPLRRMQSVTGRIAKGDLDVRTGVRQRDEIGQLAGDIDILSRQLSEAEVERQLAEENRRSFVSGISHELKTPVTVLRASLEAVEAEVMQDPEQLRHYSSLLAKEVQQLDRFITDLLEITNLQNPGFVIQKEALAPYDVVMDAVRSQRHIAQKKDITLQVVCEPLPLMAEGDYGRLRQLFSVLLSNAIKYSEPSQEVEIRCSWQAPLFEVRIIDRGRGMDAEEMKEIFTRFYRGKETGQPGSGLGLAIAREIADRHGATLTVESAPGVGSVFIVGLQAELHQP